jgi:hypothetical protein
MFSCWVTAGCPVSCVEAVGDGFGTACCCCRLDEGCVATGGAEKICRSVFWLAVGVAVLGMTRGSCCCVVVGTVVATCGAVTGVAGTVVAVAGTGVDVGGAGIVVAGAVVGVAGIGVAGIGVAWVTGVLTGCVGWVTGVAGQAPCVAPGNCEAVAAGTLIVWPARQIVTISGV